MVESLNADSTKQVGHSPTPTVIALVQFVRADLPPACLRISLYSSDGVDFARLPLVAGYVSVVGG